MEEKSVSVFLFTGFLEAGKTEFIINTLDVSMLSGPERKLLITCERGTKTYPADILAAKNIVSLTLEKKSELEKNNLERISALYNPEYIIIEYNGVWPVNELVKNKPDNWKIIQSVLVADAGMFLMYNKSYHGLVADKLVLCHMVIFNRYENKADVHELHSIVRQVNRSAEICYVADSGMVYSDDIEDPLPYDINADNIIIKDRDYAVWYSDIMEDASRYQGKTVTFKCIITKDPVLPENFFAAGRYIMTCCEDDMEFGWLLTFYPGFLNPGEENWYSVTAVIDTRYNANHQVYIPMLRITSLYECDPPLKKTADFL